MNAGSDPVSFEASAVWSRGIVMFIQTWLWFGNTMIMMMSGIMGINPSLFEAAAIDGASSGQVLRKVTLPLLRPMVVYTLITSMIGGLQMFDIPYLYHTGAGKINVNLRTVAVFVYEQFRAGAKVHQPDYGIAGAASVILFIITAALGILVFRMTSIGRSRSVRLWSRNTRNSRSWLRMEVWVHNGKRWC